MDPPGELTATYLQEKIQEYRNFFGQVLQPGLKAATKSERETKQEIDNYRDLKKRLLSARSSAPAADGGIQLPKEHEVDLGHRRVFCRAVVEDATKVYVDVGMGFHVEMLVSEASELVDKRLDFLQSVHEKKIKALLRARDHCQSTERILEELDRELRRIGH